MRGVGAAEAAGTVRQCAGAERFQEVTHGDGSVPPRVLCLVCVCPVLLNSATLCFELSHDVPEKWGSEMFPGSRGLGGSG